MKILNYYSNIFLECGNCRSDIIICLNEQITADGAPFINAVIANVQTKSCNGVPVYQYVIEYSENSLANPDNFIKESDVTGIRCRDCLTEYIDFQTTIEVEDTESVDLTLNGRTLSADVNISADEGNVLVINNDGLYVPASETINVQDTNSVDLTLTGTVLSADVKISADVGNAITIEPDGLYVPTASGVDTIGTLNSETKSANGAVINGSTLVLQTADATNPGLVSIGAQSFAGIKTFNNTVILGSITGPRPLKLNILQEIIATQINLASLNDVTGVLGEINGGTGESSYSVGDILYANGMSSLSRRTIGATNDVLTVAGGVPVWAAPAPSGILAIGTIDSETKSANGAVIDGTDLVLQTADAAFPGLVSTGTQTFEGDKTFNDDVSVLGDLTVDTLTASLPVKTDALKNLISGAIDLASAEVTGVLDEGNGGTGQSTFTTGDILYASGSNTLSKLAIGSTNDVLTVVAGVPTWAAGGGGSGITTLNTLTAAVQTFAVGTTGTDFNISSATSTHTFNLPDASTSNRGVITTGAQTFAGAKTFNANITGVSNIIGSSSSSQLVIGTGSIPTLVTNVSGTQVAIYAERRADLARSAHAFSGTGNSSDALNLDITRTRAASAGTATTVQNGDNLGSLRFFGADGTAYRQAANITVAVDGTPGASDMPGRIVFSNTPDGSATPVETWRINNAGNVLYSASVCQILAATNNQTLFIASANASNVASGSYIQMNSTNNNGLLTLYAGDASGGHIFMRLANSATRFAVREVANNDIFKVDYAGPVHVRAGAETLGNMSAKVGGTVYQNMSTVGTTAGGGNVLAYSYTVPANMLNTNGQSLRFVLTGTMETGTIATRALAFVLGSSSIGLLNTNGVSIASNPAYFRVEGEIYRLGATSQLTSFRFSAYTNAFTEVPVIRQTATTEDLTTALNLEVHIAGTNNNSVTVTTFKVFWEPAA